MAASTFLTQLQRVIKFLRTFLGKRPMADTRYFKAWINPLVFFPFDDAWTPILKKPLTVDSAIEYFCAPGIDFSLEALKTRYKEVSQEPKRLVAAPAEDNILSKLVWPLRNAKASYVAGNYLGTIALCGMVCEMLTLLVYEVSQIIVNRKPLDTKTETELFGSPFEKLGQERRISVLKSFSLIDDELRAALDTVRRKRRLYLHFYSQEHTNIQLDAVQTYNATVSAVVTVIGQDLQEGKVMINPKLLKYLETKGIASSSSSVPAYNTPKRKE